MKKKIFACLMALLLTVSALAEIPEAGDDFWYLDNANVLSYETEGEIFFGSELLYKAAGAGIVVVTVDTTSDTAIDDFTYQLFNQWEICADTYYGMLLVMAIDDDDYYAMTGTKLEALIPAGDLSELLNTYLEPSFAEKNYDEGVQNFYEAAFQRVSDELNLSLNVADAKSEAQTYIAEHSDTAETASNVGEETVSAAGEEVDLSTQVGTQQTVPEIHESRRGGSNMGFLIVIIVLIIIFSGVSCGARRRRRRPPIVPPMNPHPPMGGMGGPRPRGGMGGPRGGMGGPRPMGGNRPRGGGSFFSKPSGRSGGFGGSSHGSRGGFSGGFGGSSHHGGGGRGPASRGGGAGRGR